MKFLVIFYFLIFSLGGMAGPLIHQGPGHIDPRLFTNDYESIDPFFNLVKKIYISGFYNENPLNKFIKQIKYKQRQALTAFCMSNLPPEAKDNNYCLKQVLNETLLKAWDKTPIEQTLKLVLKHLNLARNKGKLIFAPDLNLTKADPFLKDLYLAHQYLGAVKNGMVEGKALPTVKYLKKLMSLFTFGKITNRAKPQEATNLLIPVNLKKQFPDQTLFSAIEIDSLKKMNYEISDLNPPNSFFWVKPKSAIANMDLGEDLKSIEEIEVEYNFIEGSKQNGPRFIVKYQEENWEIRFLPNRVIYPHETNIISDFDLRFGSNFVHSEPVIKKLAHAIGYNVYPSIYKKKVKVYLGDNKEDFSEKNVLMINQLTSKFPDDVKVHKSLSTIKEDTISGRKYIELKSVSLHRIYDNKTILPFSNIPMNSQGNQFKREYRAFPLFAAWVDMAHPGDGLGATLVNLKNQKSPLKHVLYDMGVGLGFGYPNMFKTKFIRKVKRGADGKIKKIVLNYHPLAKTDWFKSMSIADTKWMAKLIGQFTLAQLQKAFLSTGHPELVAKIYARKLMDRRNQLLSALNLVGKETIDFTGKAVKLKRQKGWYKTINGYTKFFNKKGYLIDPENELFNPETDTYNKNWSATWLPRKGNKPYNIRTFKPMAMRLLSGGQRQIFSKFQLGPGVYNNQPTYQQFGTSGSRPIQGCAGNCFFQGFGINVTGLIPNRVILKNPTKGSTKPFLIVDYFRVAFRISSGQDFGSLFSLGTTPFTVNGYGSVFRVYEYFKVHPTDSVLNYTRGYKEGIKISGLPFKKFQKRFVDSMEEGDSMIVSKFLGLEVGLNAGVGVPPIPAINLNILNAGVGFNTHLYFLNRLTLHKEKDNHLLANWGKFTDKALNFFVQLNLAGIVIIPGLNTGINLGINQVKKRDQVFLFNLDNKGEKELLYQNLGKVSPKEIPEEFKISERNIRTNQNFLGTYLFSYIGHERRTRQITADFKNYLDGTHRREYAYEKRIDSFAKNASYYKYKSSVNEKGDFFFKIDNFLNFKKVDRKKFKRILKKIKTQVPQDFIVFDPNAIEEDMGNVKFNSSFILSHEGILKLIAANKDDICRAYFKSNNELEKIEICGTQEVPLKMKVLYNQIDKIRNTVAKLDFKDPNFFYQEENKAKIFSALKRIVKSLMKYYKKRSITKIIKILVPRDTYFQKAKLVSENYAFPGRTKTLNLSRNNRGQFFPSTRHLANSSEETFKIFSDGLYWTLRRYSYFIDPSIIYPRQLGGIFNNDATSDHPDYSYILNKD